MYVCVHLSDPLNPIRASLSSVERRGNDKNGNSAFLRIYGLLSSLLIRKPLTRNGTLDGKPLDSRPFILRPPLPRDSFDYRCGVGWGEGELLCAKFRESLYGSVFNISATCIRFMVSSSNKNHRRENFSVHI